MKKCFTKRIQKEIRPKVYELHKKKQGTPHMAGLLILIILSFFSLIVLRSSQIFLLLLVGWGFGLWGMLDDILNSRGAKNFGISLKIKLLLEIIWSVIISFLVLFLYKIDWIYLPFLKIKLELGWFFLPFFWLVLVSTINAVNITDGLDQLAGSLLFVCFLFFGIIAWQQNNFELMFFISLILAVLLAFLWYNKFPAQIFLGDTGSLSLGGMLAVTAFLTHWPLLLLVIGFPFVLETFSVILQKTSKKILHRKIFLITPLHHHFEKKGFPEQKIVKGFLILEAICLVIALLLTKT